MELDARAARICSENENQPDLIMMRVSTAVMDATREGLFECTIRFGTDGARETARKILFGKGFGVDEQPGRNLLVSW